MSLTHVLKFGSKKTSEAMLNKLLSSNVGLYPAIYDEIKAEGIFGRVSEIDRFGRDYLLKKYNADASLSVIFDEDSDGNTEEGIRIVGKAVAFLLTEEKGDAIFFYVFDTPILKRVKGETMKVTNELEFDWLRDALDKANLSYELRSVAEIQKN